MLTGGSSKDRHVLTKFRKTEETGQITEVKLQFGIIPRKVWILLEMLEVV